MKFRRERKSPAIPMNAMSDVAFLLLIFIIVVSLINYQKVVKIDYPEARQTAQDVDIEKNLNLWVDKDGTAYIDGTVANLKDIENELTLVYQTAPETRVHIIADRNTPFKNVNSILEILQLLEYRVVSFVVKD
ncbi:hypothetical protein FACS1894190_08880 [Spirochaetia bacterium]|nr:hypothetical protein FACS1894190_08880 [Spirochaetia bacterium]GHV22335.1 hypothetical protein FACS189494_09020 [Spirochaetia bacterium]